MRTQKNKTKQSPFYTRKTFLWPVGLLLGIVIVVALAFRLSPWPGALVIRTVFNHNGQQTLQAMEAYTPKTPMTILSDQHYRSGDHDALLDVYIPKTIVRAQTPLPVIVWTHGGAWLSGDKADDAPYFKLLAEQGFVVISLNYSLAPEKTYPTAVHQLNDAYAYIQANAARYHADTNKIILAGDSAGSQLSSQMAALITSPNYARQVGIVPTLKPSQLAGVVLFCGIYKMEGLTQPDPQLPKIIGWGNDVTIWSYLGTRDKSSPKIREMSAYYHVTKDFPATFISGGNGDPLTNVQSIPFANELKSLSVPVTTLFYSHNHTPSLPHEYQFNLGNDDGQNALRQAIQFAKQRTE